MSTAAHGEPLALGVLASGSGSNLQALIDAIAAGSVRARIAVVISDNADAYALERARSAEIPAVLVDRATFDDPRTYNAAIRDALLAHGLVAGGEPDGSGRGGVVVMAGYMRLLGVEVLDAFPMRVVNLHPALLPSFPGAHGIADALAHGVKVTGVTVHFADAEFDRGPIIAQRAVAVVEGDSEESLATRIHEAEHALLPEVIGLIADGRVSVHGRRVSVAPAR